jgi:murein DD-endopeptidase MepM/ murein hydrolase activator NlpD
MTLCSRMSLNQLFPPRNTRLKSLLLMTPPQMHKGVDWAARRGTPIMAAGNGRIEAAKRHSGYGNYVRIRHANGYQTAYAHMMRFGKGIRKGVRVRQGQIIGYVGTTGLSSGPHLHYEILVNNRHVDPMRIHVPRGRQLRGKKLAEFQKERKRIETLMRRAPVKTRVAKNTK